MRALVQTIRREDQLIRQRGALLLLGWLTLFAAANIVAQDRRGQGNELESRVVKLTTKDDVDLLAMYYPARASYTKGEEAGDPKTAVTVMIVHEWRGQASPYFELAEALVNAGCAVIIPEYRGHGGSREYTDPRGQKKQFNVSRMTQRDVEKIITMDLESVKGFLKEENNAGLLNLNALVLIGIREGAVLAGRWAERDWKFPSVGRIKQGQDVKALVYVSPEAQLKGIGLDGPLVDPHLIQLPLMIVAGEGSPEAVEAARIAKRVEAIKTRIGRGTLTGFQSLMPETKLSGARLINGASAVIPAIIDFVQSQVESGEGQNAWVARK